ncbi:MAG: hypothetical protein HY832_01255 [Candidatus Aenigmarchaeota archaeon]|nr:hypothetical protein [Candidatus Aenigmarchaeota archaeon]
MAQKRRRLSHAFPKHQHKKRHRGPSYSYVTREQIFLDEHDEEKVLLFATGIMFGLGIATTFVSLGFATFIFLVVGLILLFIEQRQM